MKIIGFYTKDTPYELEAEKFEADLIKYNLNYHIYPIENQHNWVLNCGQKSTILHQALNDFKENILYIDVDARILKQPDFTSIEKDIIGISIWHNSWGSGKSEVLSGTIYLPYTEDSLDLTKKWIKAQNINKYMWDQQILDRIYYKYPFFELPLEWCYIAEGMGDWRNKAMKSFIKDPIIHHTQASRRLKGLIK